TGTVTLLNNGVSVGPPVALNSKGTASYNVYDQQPLAPGSYQLAASYSGDASYNPSTSSSSNLTITKAQTISAESPSTLNVSANGSVTFTTSMGADSIGNLPTGNMVIQSGSTVLGQAAIQGSYQTENNIVIVAGTATITVPANKFPQNGTNPVTAYYSGDANYSASNSGAVGITVTGLSAPGFTLSSSGNATVGSPGASGSAAITVVPSAGFTGTVNLTCSVVTAPSNAASPPSCAAASATVAGTSAATATLTIGSTSSTTPGSYILNVLGKDAATGRISASTSLTVTVNSAPAFALAATPVTLTSPGASGSSSLTVTPANLFTGTVNLVCAVLSAQGGAVSAPTCAPASASVTGSSPATVTLTIDSTSMTTPGAYSLAVTGTDAATGKISASTTMAVTVGAAALRAAPSFALAATAITIANPGNSASSTVTVTPANGFTGVVGLSCAVASAPDGAVSAPVCSSASENVTGSSAATGTLNVVTTSSTTPGTYTLMLTGTASGVAPETATMTVIVNQGTTPSFTLSNTTIGITSIGGSGTSTITITPSGGFNGQVNLKCALSSSPAGVTTEPVCSFGLGSTVIVSGDAPATVTMTVTTSNSATAAVEEHWFGTAGGIAVAGLLLIGVPVRRRRWPVLLVLLLLGGIAGIGCGGGGSKSSSTSNPAGAGAYAFTVTGTDATTGTIVGTTTVTVNVQ
ncbi:MAG TPA: Ig-like domain repeat protein, partial [Silvibacterium sp.]|nr:Ig-like domain repeat protein [Silvibacterium sp.]